jgi:hypothetical protein
MRFSNAIRFRQGVSRHLVRLDGLLRALLHREWASRVAAINRLPEARLEAHLFGIDRTALRPVLPGLVDLQQGRCFYCDARLRVPEVDHFLPWSRVSLDAIENLLTAADLDRMEAAVPDAIAAGCAGPGRCLIRCGRTNADHSRPEAISGSLDLER